MRGTCGKSLVPTFCGANPQDSRENIKVGNENDEQRKGKVASSHNKHGRFFVIGI
jgi:hypothetical protein